MGGLALGSLGNVCVGGCSACLEHPVSGSPRPLGCRGERGCGSSRWAPALRGGQRSGSVGPPWCCSPFWGAGALAVPMQARGQCTAAAGAGGACRSCLVVQQSLGTARVRVQLCLGALPDGERVLVQPQGQCWCHSVSARARPWHPHGAQCSPRPAQMLPLIPSAWGWFCARPPCHCRWLRVCAALCSPRRLVATGGAHPARCDRHRLILLPRHWKLGMDRSVRDVPSPWPGDTV